MAIRDLSNGKGRLYKEARQTYQKWAAKQRFPKSFKDWLRENVGTKPKKFNSVKEAKGLA